jgi:hypothetical protein
MKNLYSPNLPKAVKREKRKFRAKRYLKYISLIRFMYKVSEQCLQIHSLGKNEQPNLIKHLIRTSKKRTSKWQTGIRNKAQSDCLSEKCT